MEKLPIVVLSGTWEYTYMHTIEITHRSNEQRFISIVDGHEAELTYKPAGEGVLDMNHTYVPDQLRGMGIAAQLTAHALNYARQQNYRVIPSCPYVAAYIDKHEQYKDLLA